VVASKKLLLVEDQEFIALAGAKMLRAAGYEVEIAETGEVAVEAVSRDPRIDLVHMDINLGRGMSGPEAAKIILAGRSLPVVYLTSHTDRATVEKVRGTTCYGFVEKNSGDFVLLTAIDMAFDLFEARRIAAELNLEDELRYFHVILSTIPSLVILTGADGDTPIYVSANSLRLTGFTPGELLDGFQESADGEDRESVMRVIREASDAGRDGNHLEFRARRKDGTVWHASASWRSIRGDSGAYKGRIFQITDITELQEAKTALRESEQKYRTIADYTVNWESWFSPSGEYLWVNPGVREITGYTKEEVLAMPDFISVMVAEVDRAAFYEVFHEAIRKNEPNSNFEFRFLRKDGEIRWLNVSWKPIFDDDGKPLGLRSSGHDVTEQRLAEASVKQLLAEKVILLREVHHRIKNNMSLLSSMLSLQAGMVSNPEASSTLKDMRGRIAGMVSLYDSLYRSDSFKTLSTDAYLTVILKGILAQFAGSSTATLTWDIVDKEMDSLLLFPLGIIMNELVTNAYKHAFPNGGEGHIGVTLRESGPDGFEIIVEDDGVGLAEDARAGRSGGFGFLLVETLTQQVGGTLERKSAQGEGTEFRMRFTGSEIS
jgi:PAS domain S-box-containing protein